MYWRPGRAVSSKVASPLLPRGYRRHTAVTRPDDAMDSEASPAEYPPMSRRILLVVATAAACSSNPASPSSDDAAAALPPDAAIDAPEAAPDPIALAAEVSQDELTATIHDMEGMGSRYTFGAGDDTARDYLVGRLEAYGLPVELDPFQVDGEQANNIIAKKTGTEDPNVVFIFSAHYDSISTEPMSNAPGADDNASGVAAVLEAARILAPLSFRYSLWFVAMAAEEQGSLGSAHMASWLKSDGIDVRGVIAPDMIAYWPLGDGDALDILGDSGSSALGARMAGFAQRLGVTHKIWMNHDYCYGDDHTNFQEAGFPAISPMDCVEAHNLPESGEDTPSYHQPSDRMGTLYLPFTTKVAQVIVATFADLGEPLGHASSMER